MRTFAYEGAAGMGLPSPSTSTSSPGSGTPRTSPGSSVTTRSATPPASRGRVRASTQLEAMERYVAEAMHAGALGLSTGLEFNPGREAPTERDRAAEHASSAATAGTTRATSATATRELQHSIEEFLFRSCARAERSGQISHFNVRHRTRRRPGAWQRAVETMRRRTRRRARRARRHDAVPATGSASMAGILPPGCSPTGGRRPEAAPRPGCSASALPHECDRYWRFIHRGEWGRVRLQASPQYPGLAGARTCTRSRRCSARARGSATSTSSPPPGPRSRASS